MKCYRCDTYLPFVSMEWVETELCDNTSHYAPEETIAKNNHINDQDQHRHL